MEKIREKSGNFVSPEEWEPCISVSKGTLKNFLGGSILKLLVNSDFSLLSSHEAQFVKVLQMGWEI